MDLVSRSGGSADGAGGRDVPAVSHHDDRIWIMFSSALLGWLGAALSIALPWPQVWRSVVRGRTKGLSATACWQGTAMPAGWITYGLLSGETVQVVTNTVTGVAGLAVLVMVLVKEGELRTRRALLVSAAGAAGVLAAAALSAAAGVLTGIGSAHAAEGLSAVLAFSAILGAIPQPLSLLRDRGQDLAGLSPLRWWLAAGACSSWCSYGLATGQVAVWLSALVGLSSALIVCWVLAADRRATTATTPAVVSASAAVATAFAGKAAVATAPVLRAAHSGTRMVRPAVTTISAAARVARPASVTARPVYGATRLARPARGVARVPRSADRATLIMSREFAPA
jgi:uncharacterized protein with PQ loop repeat